jgi:hypothetical protein
MPLNEDAEKSMAQDVEENPEIYKAAAASPENADED